jgi:hypothetical protein
MKISLNHLLAETIQAACIQVALDGHKDVGMINFCYEGVWRSAIDAIYSLNMQALLEQMAIDSKNGPVRSLASVCP